jgi:excisionase family DNA binding protein
MANNIIVQYSERDFRELLKSCISESIKESEISSTHAASDNLLSIQEASAFLNLATQTLYGFTSNRSIPFIKKGKKLYFKKSALESWLSEGRKATVKEMSEGTFTKIKGGKHV